MYTFSQLLKFSNCRKNPVLSGHAVDVVLVTPRDVIQLYDDVDYSGVDREIKDALLKKHIHCQFAGQTPEYIGPGRIEHTATPSLLGSSYRLLSKTIVLCSASLDGKNWGTFIYFVCDTSAEGQVAELQQEPKSLEEREAVLPLFSRENKVLVHT